MSVLNKFMVMQIDFNALFENKNEFIDKIGIYSISNKYDSKNYVGQTSHSKGFFGRWADHRELLRANKHDNIYLQRSFNKRGENQFIFKILEICDSSINLNLREHYWIENLQSMYNQNGWNIDYIDVDGKRICDYRPKIGKEFTVMSPEGEIITGTNRKLFALENGLDDGNFCRLINGKKLTHKGWKSIHPDAIRELPKYTVVSPDGTIYDIDTPCKFAREHGVRPNNFHSMIKGKIKSCEGWTLIQP